MCSFNKYVHQDAQLASSFIIFFKGLVIVQKYESFQPCHIFILPLLTPNIKHLSTNKTDRLILPCYDISGMSKTKMIYLSAAYGQVNKAETNSKTYLSFFKQNKHFSQIWYCLPSPPVSCRCLRDCKKLQILRSFTAAWYTDFVQEGVVTYQSIKSLSKKGTHPVGLKISPTLLQFAGWNLQSVLAENCLLPV